MYSYRGPEILTKKLLSPTYDESPQVFSVRHIDLYLSNYGINVLVDLYIITLINWFVRHYVTITNFCFYYGIFAKFGACPWT